MTSAWFSRGTFSREEGSRFDGKVSRAEGQAEPPRAMLSRSGWSLRQYAFAANPIVEFTVHSTPDGISGGQPNRVQPRRTAQKKTTSQVTSSCFGLVHESGKWHKEHALSNHAKSEPPRVGRDWPVMLANRKLPLVCKRNLPKDRSPPISTISSDKSNVAPS